MNKKYLIISFLCLAITLTGCSGVSNKQRNLYTNDESIAQEGDTYSYLSRISSNDSNEKNNKIELQFSKFYGSDTLLNIVSREKQKLELNFISEITKGKFKAVLITPAEEVLVIFEGSGEGTKIIDVNEGKYRFKIVGQDAGGKMQLEIKENINIELEKNE
jgi:hypothetical protein